MQKIGQYVSIDNSVAVVDVEGKYDLGITANVFDDLEKAYRQGCTSVLFEMANTTYIVSATERMIYKICRTYGGAKNVQISNAQGRVLSALQAAAVDKFITVNGGQVA